MPHFGEPPFPIPRYQPPVFLDQPNPVSGTQYQVIGALRNVRIIAISISCNWTVQPDPLELYATKDGIPLRWYFATPATATFYYPIGMDSRAADNAMLLTATQRDDYRPFLFEARRFGPILAEITGGTVQFLRCRVKYARY